MNELSFRVSSGLKNIIGKELITNEVVAVFELVKNSYDAGSERVEVVIDLSKDEMRIMDSGKGMSYDDLVNKWLFVAYSEKKDSQISNNKAYVGAKGIGRFACDRLGQVTHIYTKTSLEKSVNYLVVDWSNFENDLLDEFTSIKVNYEESSDSSQLLSSSGTTIVIKELSDKWDKTKINRLRDSLSKLINPFSNESLFEINLKILSEDNSLAGLSRKIENKIMDVIENKTVSISAVFEDDSIFVELKDRGEIVYSFKEKSNKALLSNIKMNVFYLNRSSKVTFKRRMGIDTVNYGNIFMYKNKFRVYPYGEEDFDGFGLDKRKTQGYNRYLGNRELLGSIEISDKANHFIEVSSRDRGFIENIYTESLVDNYMNYVHKPLEKYVKLIKWGYDNEKDLDITYQDVVVTDESQILPTFVKGDNFDININSNLISGIKPSLDKRIEAISQSDPEDISSDEIKDVLSLSKEKIRESQEQIADHAKERKKTSEQLKNLEKQNKLLRNLTDNDVLLQAEITHHMSKSANNLRSYADNIIEVSRNSEIFSYIIEDLSSIKAIAARLNVFNDVILKGNFYSKSKTAVNLYEYFDFYINNSGSVSAYRSNIKITLWLDQSSTDMDSWKEYVDVYDISVLIDNMLSNVFDLRGSFLDIEFTENKNREIVFFSDTPHIDKDNLNKVFELGFSTKPSGTGIGLYHIKETIEDNGWNISAKNVEKGVKFVIVLKGDTSYEK